MSERFFVPESELTSSSAEDSMSIPPILRSTTDTTEGGGGKKKKKTKQPVVVLVVGMAGSGKTTLMSQLYRSLASPPPPAPAAASDATTTSKEEEESRPQEEEGKSSQTTATDNIPAKSDGDDEDDGREEQVEEEKSPTSDEMEKKKKVGYFLNLDPATTSLPFGASIDIRDTVNYREVMRQHNLGPNGAIMTSLNLFATKFDQVLQILEKRSFSDDEDGLDYIVVDTPGQIEAFTWSASGQILSEGLASSFPTVLAFVVDTPRCAASTNTFMSNMLYACSMLYRTRLPLVVVFNKTDVVPHDFATKWMTDYDSFQEALDDNASDNGYYGSLTRSLSLVLDEFYSNLHHVGVSAATGDGIAEFWDTVQLAKQEFLDEYVPDLRCRMEEQNARKRAGARESARRLERDLMRAASQPPGSGSGDGDIEDEKKI